jgi:N6-L-threonylcarbamoyladenine synthase
VPVNHLAGHALTPRLTDGVVSLSDAAGVGRALPVSAGRRAVDRFRRLGGTIDDAPGEAFDKTAKLLALPQPGGPVVEAEALLGDPAGFRFPAPALDREGCDMSFSGLKTALLRARDAIIAEKGGITVQDRRDLCAGFQAAVAEVLASQDRARADACRGGVRRWRCGRCGGKQDDSRGVRDGCRQGWRAVPGPAAAALHRQCRDDRLGRDRTAAGRSAPDPNFVARPRWPLDDRAQAMLGSGKKGAKA